ncbi:MAG: hypothetical protein BGO69_14920 [Bacteroidetes bacterium 46-16]|nr:MAG: hypothetical protein BGO69_14920 [Bacteroidetes bacterium 46-16]
MKIIQLFLLCPLLGLMACHQNESVNEEQTVRPKIPVEVVSVESGSVSNNLELTATSIYLRRNIVTVPIAAFITKVNTHLGERVAKGQVLYELQTKERRALGNDLSGVDPSLKNFGMISVKASASGIISTFDKQQPGEYVLEGTPLCTIAESSALAFQVNVPYEFSDIVKPGKKCMLTLPDRTHQPATITTPLTSMNAASQTQTLLAKPDENLFLPENLIAKVEVSRGIEGNKQILPKQCVLSDEMMKEFWVMKLINDSTAVKVQVEPGNKNTKTIEILSPVFKPADRIISTGNYGLPDTALVSVTPKN